jgi:hypothetical protein
MKACGRVKIRLHSFLTSALDRAEFSTSSSGHFTSSILRKFWIAGQNTERLLDDLQFAFMN